jgi:hypothetical protein
MSRVAIMGNSFDHFVARGGPAPAHAVRAALFHGLSTESGDNLLGRPEHGLSFIIGHPSLKLLNRLGLNGDGIFWDLG